MDEKLFAELVEMGAYLKGEIPPERLMVVRDPEFTRITILVPDDPRCSMRTEADARPGSASAARTNAG